MTDENDVLEQHLGNPNNRQDTAKRLAAQEFMSRYRGTVRPLLTDFYVIRFAIHGEDWATVIGYINSPEVEFHIQYDAFQRMYTVDTFTLTASIEITL